MIGMDLRSDTKYYNNIYKRVLKTIRQHTLIPDLRVYEKQVVTVLKTILVSFYKVNKSDDDKDY